MINSKNIVLAVVVIGVILVVLAWVIVRAAVSGMQSSENYFAPIYSPDGQHVYFVERRTSGTVRRTKPPDLLFGSPEFDVQVAKDTFTVKRLHVRSGQVEELFNFAPSPIEGRKFEAIGYPFPTARARLRFTKEGQLETNLCLSTTGKEYSASGVWSEAQPAAEINRSWQDSRCEISGYNEWPLFGNLELMQVRGELASFPVAIVAYNHVSDDVQVLVKSKDYDRFYPQGVPLEEIRKNSARAAIERLQTVLRTHEELLQKYKAEGMSENPARLRVIKDMQRLGYYPKPTMIVARQLSRDEITKARIEKDSLFDVAKGEMESGVFQDIEQAIASPGEEIEHNTTGYHIHRDYSNSARLNAFLKTGNTRFYVRYLGVTYELTIRKP